MKELLLFHLLVFKFYSLAAAEEARKNLAVELTGQLCELSSSNTRKSAWNHQSGLLPQVFMLQIGINQRSRFSINFPRGFQIIDDAIYF